MNGVEGAPIDRFWKIHSAPTRNGCGQPEDLCIQLTLGDQFFPIFVNPFLESTKLTQSLNGFIRVVAVAEHACLDRHHWHVFDQPFVHLIRVGVRIDQNRDASGHRVLVSSPGVLAESVPPIRGFTIRFLGKGGKIIHYGRIGDTALVGPPVGCCPLYSDYEENPVALSGGEVSDICAKLIDHFVETRFVLGMRVVRIERNLRVIGDYCVALRENPLRGIGSGVDHELDIGILLHRFRDLILHCGTEIARAGIRLDVLPPSDDLNGLQFGAVVGIHVVSAGTRYPIAEAGEAQSLGPHLGHGWRGDRRCGDKRCY